MLTIVVPGAEHFNQETQEFFTVGDYVLELEHSLVSLSKWEARFNKPFLAPGEKTTEEVIGYIEAMALDPNTPREVFTRLTEANYEEINTYIDQKMSATWFKDTPTTGRSGEIITAELIYYWMATANMPLEFERWHLNRLFTLLRVFGAKNGKQKKMSKAEIARQNAEINARRLKQYNTTG